MEHAISFFEPPISNLKPTRSVTLLEVKNKIKDDEYLRGLTEELRSSPTKELKDKIKRQQLPYVTFGGVFEKRTDRELRFTSGLICIDIDGLEAEQIDYIIKELIVRCPFLILVFISPSGKGLKVVFKTNGNKDFKANYAAYSFLLINSFNVPSNSVDSSCAVISKACFLCHDKNAFLNPKVVSTFSEIPFIPNEYFNFSHTKKEELSNQVKEEEESKEYLFELSSFDYYPLRLDFTKRNSISNYIALCKLNIRKAGILKVGNRHNYFFHLALLTNLLGMEPDSAIAHSKSFFSNHEALLDRENRFDEENDLVRPMKNVYEKNKEFYSTWQENNLDWETPLIREDVYKNLPTLFSGILDKFSGRGKDNLLLAMLTLCSTYFPRIKGVYKGKAYRLNLYLFVVAPPASEKGIVAETRKIAEVIHQEFVDEYKIELQHFKELSEEDQRKLEEPQLKKFLLPANTTSAQLISNLFTNQIFGVVLDTEADTLSNANRSEHGHFSELFRKAFEHESIEYERKTKKEYLVIPEPAFSVILTGTPRQVKSLFGDIENGLTSRFMFYTYTVKPIWKDVFEEVDDLSFIFRVLGNKLSLKSKPYFQEYILQRENEIYFSFTNRQKKVFHLWFEEKLKGMDYMYGADIQGAVKRMGVIFFRISMVLTLLRHIDGDGVKPIPSCFFCDDIDFDTAHSLTETLLLHTAYVFKGLREGGKSKNFKQLRDLYYEKLPKEFDRTAAMQVAELMQIKEKTAENICLFINKQKN
jgi:hypothetical protein